MQKKEQIQIIEALLFASPEPLSQKRINLVFDSDPPNLKQIVEELNNDYASIGRAFEIETVAGGFQLISKKEYDF